MMLSGAQRQQALDAEAKAKESTAEAARQVTDSNLRFVIHRIVIYIIHHKSCASSDSDMS